MAPLFDEYVEKELLRLSNGEDSLESRCSLLFSTQPRLEIPLMLAALCISFEDADQLVTYVANMDLPEQCEAHRKKVISNWQEMISVLRKSGEDKVRMVLVDADGDEMESVGFPIPYAKYADTYFFWKNREFLDKRLNNTYRRKYKRLLEKGKVSLEECEFMFDENFQRFINGKFDYSYEQLKDFVLNRSLQ